MWFLLSGYAVSMLSMYRTMSAQSLCFCSASSPAAVASDSAVPSLLKPAFLRCSVNAAWRTLEMVAVGPTGFLERAMSCTPPTHASELVHTVLQAPRTPRTPCTRPAHALYAPTTPCARCARPERRRHTSHASQASPEPPGPVAPTAHAPRTRARAPLTSTVDRGRPRSRVGELQLWPLSYNNALSTRTWPVLKDVPWY